MADHADSSSDRPGEEFPEFPGKGYEERGIQDPRGAPTAKSEGSATNEKLRAAKEYAEMIVDTIREGLLILDLDLRVRSANQSFYEMFKTDPEETVGQFVYEFGDSQWDLPELHTLLEDLLPKSKTLNDYEVDHEFEDVGRRVMLLNARQIDEHELVLLAIEDVTERRRAERELRTFNERLERQVQARTREVREKEAQFRALIEASAQIVWTTDPQGRPLDRSPTWEAFTGQSHEERRGHGWVNALHPDDRKATLASWQRALETRASLDVECRVYHADADAWRWAHVRIVPLYDDDGAVRGWVGMAIDINERKKAEEHARGLATALTLAEHRERRRIAGILHDEVQQLLFGVEMSLRRAQRGLSTPHASESREHSTADFREELLASLKQAQEILDEAVEATRTLSAELAPSVLRQEGLPETLEWLAQHMEERYGLSVTLRFEDVPEQESLGLRALIYRLARELLFNVVKHAGTKHAKIVTRVTSGTLIVEVSDEGQGFNPEAVEGEEGYGLSVMRERLHSVGGHLELEAAPGEGVCARLVVPDDFGSRAEREGRSDAGRQEEKQGK